MSRSFVRCLEVSGADCVDNRPEMRAFDALTLLSWVYESPPMAILGAFNEQLRAHSKLERAQRRFVDTAHAARVPMQGARCNAAGVYEVDNVLGRLVPAIYKRLAELGLDDADMKSAIEGLAKEARQDQGQAQLVEITCEHAPQLRWFAGVTRAEGKLFVVGLTTKLPALALGNTGEQVLEPAGKGPTLWAQGSQTQIHPWIDLDWEVF